MAVEPIVPNREIWAIQVRSDNPVGPEIIIQSEHVLVTNQARHVLKRLPDIRSQVADVQDVKIVLDDGKKTTIGACVRALYIVATEVVDHFEELYPNEHPAGVITVQDMLSSARKTKK